MSDKLKDLVEDLTREFCANKETMSIDDAMKVSDMILDFAKAHYYCTVSEAMEKSSYEMTAEMYKEHNPEYYRSMDKSKGMMYYTENPNTMSNRMNKMPEIETMQDGMERDMSNARNRNMSQSDMNNSNARSVYEGKAGMSRKTYMEHKKMNPEDKRTNQNNAEMMITDTIADIKETWAMMTPEERSVVKAKLNAFISSV